MGITSKSNYNREDKSEYLDEYKDDLKTGTFDKIRKNKEKE